ncbi:MAG: exodeoxyribonuclease VII small subunit [Patescibacteria group bacterium]|nr:exodeoxyribonuclease VII small subunit [Patescibacteria group bacterium]
MPEKKSFEDVYSQIERAVKKLEESELSMDESMKLYGETLKKIEIAKKMLGAIEGKIKEIKI